MNQPKIIAFMQNPWFTIETPRTVVDKYKTDQEFHKRILLETMSGQRLINAFGPTVFHAIHWDNVAPEAAPEADGETEIDPSHVEKVISVIEPDLIITFGNLAKSALKNSILAEDIHVMNCHHPNARYKTAGDLGEFAIRVSEWCDQWRIDTARDDYKKKGYGKK